MKRTLFTFLFLTLCVICFAQVGVNNTMPNKNSLLEISNLPGEKKGVLIPRISLVQRDSLTYVDPLANPKVLRLSKNDDSLLIFNTTSNRYNFWNGPKESWYTLNGGYNGPFDLPDAVMTFNCDTDVILTGEYTQSKALSEEHSNVMSFIVNVEEIGNYTIEAISTNGYSFVATGTFLFKGKAIIRAVGSGTPKNNGTDKLIVRVNSKKSTCEPSVTIKQNVPMKKIKILSIGVYPSVSYETKAGFFLNTPINFGNIPESRVSPSEGFEFENMEYKSGSNASFQKVANFLRKDVNNTPVDILILGEEFSSGADGGNDRLYGIVKNYLFDGGVVIVTSSNRKKNDTTRLIPILLGETSTTVYSPRDFTSTTGRYVKLPNMPEDPIINGPFGNLGDKYIWQNESYEKYPGSTNPYKIKTTGLIIQSPALNNIVIYTQNQGYVEMFRSKTHNLFFYGNEDAFQNNYGASWLASFYPEATYYHNYQYAFNTTNTLNQVRGAYQSYNSALFGNLMYWAMQQANINGINAK